MQEAITKRKEILKTDVQTVKTSKNFQHFCLRFDGEFPDSGGKIETQFSQSSRRHSISTIVYQITMHSAA